MIRTAEQTDRPVHHPCDARVAAALAAARTAQTDWSQRGVGERLQAVRACRIDLVRSPEEWGEEITDAGRRSLADSLAAEVLPLADACRFLERNAERLLKDTKPSSRDRPLWGRGLSVRVRREPLGVVLIVGAGNYPLFLAGVQALQAVAAGNAVLVKPSPGCTPPMQRLANVLERGGAPRGLIQVLDESPAAAQHAMTEGVARVVLTGSAATGRKVLAQAAESLTPCTMELSGCDALFVLPGADLDRVARAIAFGLRLNGSATCIGPRRIFVTSSEADKLIELLPGQLSEIPPTVIPPAVAQQAKGLVNGAMAAGARALSPADPTFDAAAFLPVLLEAPGVDLPLLRADLFAPVASIVRVDNPQAALELSRQCPYALGAGVFGPQAHAESFANKVEAGCVTVNDLVAPTADPRVPFGGWNDSGFGVTRGAEGLLELTRIKAVVTQRSRWLPHLDPPRAGLDRLVVGLLRMAHGESLAERWRGLREVISASRSKS